MFIPWKIRRGKRKKKGHVGIDWEKNCLRKELLVAKAPDRLVEGKKGKVVMTRAAVEERGGKERESTITLFVFVFSERERKKRREGRGSNKEGWPVPCRRGEGEQRRLFFFYQRR